MRRARRITPFALFALATIALASFVSIGTAGAWLQPFRLSPSSGPPGSVVTVSGTDCTPGPVVAAGTDYVNITSTTLPISVDVRVAANGSWRGQLTVPGSQALGVGLVGATCFTNGMPSATTYSPQSFTVTNPSTTPTTGHAVRTPAPTPGAAVGGPPTHPAVPNAPSAGNRGNGSGSNGSGSGTNAGRGSGSVTAVNPATAAASKLATASGADHDLTANSTSGHHRSPWLWWLLFVIVLAAVAATLVYIRRRHDANAETVPSAPTGP